MKFFFTIAGLMLGALSGSFFGFLLGGVAGFVLGAMLKEGESNPAEPTPTESSTGDAFVFKPQVEALASGPEPTTALTVRLDQLDEKLARLTTELTRLTAQLARWEGAPKPAMPTEMAVAIEPATVIEPAPEPAAPAPEPVPEPILVVEPVTQLVAVAEVVATPVPTAEPEPQPADIPTLLTPPKPLASQQERIAEAKARAHAKSHGFPSLPQPEIAASFEPAAPISAAPPWPATTTPPWSTPATAPLAAEPLPPPAAPLAPLAPPPPPLPPSPSLKERMPAFLRNWIFGGNTIVKIGVLILFLGLAFLLRYAAERVTVPVEIRYAFVGLVGAVLLAVGWRLRQGRDKAGGTGFGQILQGAGIGVFYLTTLAALKLNQLLPPGVAFAFLFLTAVFATLLAVAQSAPWLAYAAAAGGFAAPVLVSTGSGGNHIVLFSCMAILDLGIFFVAGFKAWRPLNLIGFIGTFGLAGAWANKYYNEGFYGSTQAFLLLFFLLFAATGVLYARRALAREGLPALGESLSERAAETLAQMGRVDSALVFGLPLVTFGLQYLLVQRSPYGPALAALGFSVFYLVLGGGLLRSALPRYALLGEAYVIVSAIFGTLSVPLALGSGWTGATWAVEAAGMYWLGSRQHRTYTRALALLLLFGAASRMLGTMSLTEIPGAPLLDGPVLNMLMLAASAMAIAVVGRARLADADASMEQLALLAQPWIAVAATLAGIWSLLPPLWASAATGALALACALAHRRFGLPTLKFASVALHILALAGLASSLHAVPGTTMLAGGWPGQIAMALIALCLLAPTWQAAPPALADEAAGPPSDTPSLRSGPGAIATVLAVALLSLCPLFLMPADRAAHGWPLLGLALTWFALKRGQASLAICGLGLQIAAACVFLLATTGIWSADRVGATFWTPLALTLAAAIGGLWRLNEAHTARMRWLAMPELQWLTVGWLLLWWAYVLPPDGLRLVARLQGDATQLMPMLGAAWVLLTSVAMVAIARRFHWRQLGIASAATLPALVVAACLQTVTAGLAPHAALGWLVWPLAFAWHWLLLRAQERWLGPRLLSALHAGGFWLYVLLATRELHGLMGHAPGDGWALLSWVLVPALALFAVCRPQLAARWPVSAYAEAYRGLTCAPLAVGLLAWLWLSNLQAGSAAPLPYLPLLNPLELGHGLVLLALFVWGRSLPAHLRQHLPTSQLLPGAAATAFALLTGMVLRACHHWADVPWLASALFGSKLAQAALSVTWAIVGVAAMLIGHKRARRLVWVCGAALLGVVVVKLFFVELGDRGGLARIVSFILVGLLMLVVGYFAPVPPSRKPPAQHEEASDVS